MGLDIDIGKVSKEVDLNDWDDVFDNTQDIMYFRNYHPITQLCLNQVSQEVDDIFIINKEDIPRILKELSQNSEKHGKEGIYRQQSLNFFKYIEDTFDFDNYWLTITW